MSNDLAGAAPDCALADRADARAVSRDPARPVSKALLVSGPLHGAVLPLASERAVTLTPESEGEQYLYVRRGLAATDAETAIFVYGGRPTTAQFHDAVQRSSLTQTAKMRVLGPGDEAATDESAAV